MSVPDSSKKMRERSGEVDSDSLLVRFLYILMRDHVTAGVVESIMDDHVENGETLALFSNGWLASNAIDLADRLLSDSIMVGDAVLVTPKNRIPDGEPYAGEVSEIVFQKDGVRVVVLDPNDNRPDSFRNTRRWPLEEIEKVT